MSSLKVYHVVCTRYECQAHCLKSKREGDSTLVRSSAQELRIGCCTYDQDALLTDVVGPIAVTLGWSPSQEPAALPCRANLLQADIVNAEIDAFLYWLVCSQVNDQASCRVPQ